MAITVSAAKGQNQQSARLPQPLDPKPRYLESIRLLNFDRYLSKACLNAMAEALIDSLLRNSKPVPLSEKWWEYKCGRDQRTSKTSPIQTPVKKNK